MLDDVLAMPDHLRDALWRVESARLERADAAGLMVCGMGGSAIGGDLAAAVLGDRLTRPLPTVPGYEIPPRPPPPGGRADPPPGAPRGWGVLFPSPPGATEEPLASSPAAGAFGPRRI